MNVLSAANALRSFPPFGATSLRHLVDLVELASRDGIEIDADHSADVHAAFILVTRGHGRAVSGATAVFMGSGSVLWTNQPPFTTHAPAPPPARRGPMTRAMPGAPARIANVPVSVETTATDGMELLPLSVELLYYATAVSSSFGRSVDVTSLNVPGATTLYDIFHTVDAGPPPPPPPPPPPGTGVAPPPPPPTPWEFIWMCKDPAIDAPMEALTRTLAAATQNQFGAAPAVVIADAGGLQVAMWQPSGDFAAPVTVPSMSAIAFPANEFHRVFVVCPSSPNQLPTSLAGTLFDRIVYVTRATVTSSPLMHSPQLKQPPSGGGQPYFSAFVPSIFMGMSAPAAPVPGLPPLRPFIRAAVRDAFSFVGSTISEVLGIPSPSDGFRTEPLDDDVLMTSESISAAPHSRVERDTCRLRIHLTEIQQLWTQAQANGTVDGFHRTVLTDPHKETVYRWARAITNRRLGLAVSGGGATSYRIVPLMEMLNDAHVPIDVVGGLSAGAAIAAYYCRDPVNGLNQYKDLTGNRIAALGAILAPVTSQAIESGMDWTFGYTRVEDLEVRMVAVTTALVELGPPEAHAVIQGTLGQAVRVASSLPLFYGRTVKNGTVYTDGVTSTVIPARALPNYGADYVFGCNSIPGPKRRNPLSSALWAELLYRFTPVGPLLDSFTSTGFMAEETGHDAGLWAHVFIEPSPRDGGMMEIFRWDRAAQFLEQTRKDARVIQGAARCGLLWNKVKIDPP
jgi:predicted acylesterase/phospholipase RssA